jgi:hypothetical protein
MVAEHELLEILMIRAVECRMPRDLDGLPEFDKGRADRVPGALAIDRGHVALR